MDVVLEIFDQYVGDRLWAYMLPAFPLVQSALSPSKSDLLLPNGTYPSIRQAATGVSSSYTYHPASQYMNLEPSDFAYMSQWNRNNVWRQAASLFGITLLFGYAMYFITASLIYFTVFDPANFSHPKYLKNQVRFEIQQAVTAIPFIAVLTVPCFLLEVQGFSKMYDSTADGPGLWYDILQFPLFIAFTDCFIYWIHRGLHHKAVYKHLHKPHHKWVVPTPFASHAFHPLDGFAQSIPYHVFPFLFPLNKFAYIALFTFINIWTVTIHDGEYAMDNSIINSAACHTMHHLYFNYNYGQFTTLWDRLGGSYRRPNQELFDKDQKLGKAEWERQKKEAERMIVEIEGKDDRTYGGEAEGKKVQ